MLFDPQHSRANIFQPAPECKWQGIIPPMHQLLAVHTINMILTRHCVDKRNYIWYFFEGWMICAVKLLHKADTHRPWVGSYCCFFKAEVMCATMGA